MPFPSHLRHAIVINTLFFYLFVISAAAQPPLPSLPPPPSPANSNPEVAKLIVLVVTALFFLVFFSFYVVECTGVPINPSAHAGGSRRGVPASEGLDAEVIRGFPMFVYSEVKEHKIGKGALECMICLSEFKDYEMLRLIPRCDHVFHPECIDEWFSGHVTCPVCRANLVPPSGDSVKSRTNDSVQDTCDHVEVEIGEPTLPTDETTRGNGEEGGAFGKRPRRLGRSHSTGHSLVRPGDNTERFTLRLPDEVRKQILERPMTPYFPSEDSSSRWFRSGEGSSRGRFLLRRLDWLDRQAKSERWAFRKMPSFMTRVSSIVSPKSPKFSNNDSGPDGSSKAANHAADRDRSGESGEPAAKRDRLPI